MAIRINQRSTILGLVTLITAVLGVISGSASLEVAVPAISSGVGLIMTDA